MSLTCGYSDNYNGDGWYYYHPEVFTTLAGKRRKCCQSCKKLIEIGDCCVEFARARPSKPFSVEENIHGAEVPLAPQYACGDCGEIYLNLTDIELDFRLNLGDDWRESMREYWKITGFKPETERRNHENKKRYHG